MINLCNDVLNKERRNLFPKIQTLNHKLSLYSLFFLKKQNPLKFYKSYYDKIIKKSNNNNNLNTKLNKRIKNNSYLSLLSKTQNYFYSVPINYNFKPKNIIMKYSENPKNNNLNNIMPIKEDNSLINHSNSNIIDLLNNKSLIKMNEYLLKNNDNSMTNKKSKNQSYKDLYRDNRYDESESENSIINDKISRGQQTISNGRNYNENKKNWEMDVNNDYKKEKLFQKEKIKYIIKKKEKTNKFTIDYYRNRPKIYFKRKNNSCNNGINIIWRNLRRPIVMNFNSSLKFY